MPRLNGCCHVPIETFKTHYKFSDHYPACQIMTPRKLTRTNPKQNGPVSRKKRKKTDEIVYRFSKQGQTMVRIDRVISELRSVHRQRPYLTRVAGAVEPVLARRRPAAMPRPAWPSALDTVTLRSEPPSPPNL